MSQRHTHQIQQSDKETGLPHYMQRSMISTANLTGENIPHSQVSSILPTTWHLLTKGYISTVTPKFTQHTGHQEKCADHETAQNQSPASTDPEWT